MIPQVSRLRLWELIIFVFFLNTFHRYLQRLQVTDEVKTKEQNDLIMMVKIQWSATFHVFKKEMSKDKKMMSSLRQMESIDNSKRYWHAGIQINSWFYDVRNRHAKTTCPNVVCSFCWIAYHFLHYILNLFTKM